MSLTNILKSIAVKVFPDKLLQNLRKNYLVAGIGKSQLAEEPDLAALQAFITPGCVAIDVGANAGLYSYWFSKWVGKDGRVLAFEPIPKTFEVLDKVRVNYQLNNLTAYQIALSDRVDQVSMHIPRTTENMLPNYYQASIEKPENDTSLKEIIVATEAMDNIVIASDISRVDVVKCDVEGHELAWLKGASETIEKFEPILLIEISEDMDKPDTDAWKLNDILVNYGYSAYLLREGVLEARQAGDRPINYFYIKEKHFLTEE